MGSITTRLDRLEQRRPPVMHRPADEMFDEFMARFCVALDGVADDQFSSAMAPWLAAMRHEELRVLADDLCTVIDRQSQAEPT